MVATATKVTAGSSKEEQAVQNLGFDYEIVEIPLSKIDQNASAYNYRFTRLDEEKALEYGLAMEKGDIFPPIISHPEGKLDVTVAGVHRVYGRSNFTRFKSILSIRLKNLDLKDPETQRKLDLLRVRTNLWHGKGLDQAERKMVACQWIDSGFTSESEAAKELDLDPKALSQAMENYRVDMKLLSYGLHPDNFLRLQDKKAVLRKGLTQSDMKAMERIMVLWSRADVKHKITSTQFNRLSLDLTEARNAEEKQVVFDEFNTTIRSAQGNRTRATKAAPTPQWFLKTGMGAIRNVNTKTYVNTQVTAENAEATADEIYATMLKLAGIHDTIASKHGLPKASVIR